MPQLFVVDEQGRNQEPVSNDNPLPSKIVRPVATYAAGAIWDAPKAVKAPPVRGEDPETRETVGYGSRKVHHATDTHR